MKINQTWLLGIGLTVPLLGCPGDDGTQQPDDSSSGTTTGVPTPMTDSSSSTSADDTASSSSSGGSSDDMSDTTEGPPMECLGIGGPGADGDACTANSDCASGVCTIFTDAPVNADAICEASAKDCSTRVTGTVFNFVTGEAVEGAEVLAAPAVQASLNPTGVTEATALLADTSDADGHIDATSSGPINAPLGVVALASAPTFFLTITGVVAPGRDDMTYPVANAIHDLWMVPESDLSDWSDSLDGDIPSEFLPLGEAGGVVGLVRDATGAPIAGAEVASEDGGSNAMVRYLNDDGTFGTTETSDLGVFVIVNPGLAEVFAVSVGGMAVGGGQVGSADGAVFTLIVTTD